ncbi:MAG: DUF1517 domain-containing protein [Leptolyngbyaceae cyanobacterium bins.59]|nr:DUF1517 domain-containing protein [Leptolyngbyaceae cyanobacterium bins.59]
MRKSPLKFLGTALAALIAVQAIEVPLSVSFLGQSIEIGQEAEARSSGGRSRGGSFRRSSPSRSTTSSPSRSTNSSPSYRRESRPSYQDRGPVIVPVPGPSYNYSNSPNNNYNQNGSPSGNRESDTGDVILGLIILLLFGGVSLFVLWWIVRTLLRTLGGTGTGGQGKTALDNDVVTISKLQIALLAQARDVQTRLNEIGESIDASTPEGLSELLQESVLAILRTPENWSHVLSTSKTVSNREQAEALFNEMSVTERSKFSAETLVNTGGGRVRRSQGIKPDDDETAAYIVVTLLVGTEDDRPLFGPIRSTDELRGALEKVAAIPSDHLSVFELLWSPQEEMDSLSYDELLTEYSEMVQI